MDHGLQAILFLYIAGDQKCEGDDVVAEQLCSGDGKEGGQCCLDKTECRRARCLVCRSVLARFGWVLEDVVSTIHT